MVAIKDIFDNLQTAVPGVYFKQKFPDTNATGTVQQISVVLGTAGGGVPWNAADIAEQDRVLRINSVSDARNLLRNGNGYYGTEFYLSPHNEPNLSSPLQVGFLMVNPASRATSSLKNLLVDVIDLKSTRFGQYANQLTRRVTAGTNTGYHASVKLGTGAWEQDDITLPVMAMRYVGTGTAAVMTITSAALTTTITAGPGGEDLSLTLADFENLAQLVERINSETVYDCFLETGSDEKPDLFDAVTAVDILTAEYAVLADVEALIRWFNGRTDGELIASLSTGVERLAITPDTGYVFFTGGSDGAASISDWSGALDILAKDKRVRWIGIATGDSSVHVMARDHVKSMSNESRMKHRQMGTGAAAALLSKTDRIRAARALSCARAEYCVTPFTRFDYINNEISEFPPFYGAFLSAGTRHGNQITTSAERKFVNVSGVTETYNETDLEDYARAGCTVLEPSNGQIELRVNVTTHQGQNTILSVPSAVRTSDEVLLRIKEAIDRRMGKLTDAGSISLFSDFDNWIRQGLLPDMVDSNLARNFVNVVFTADGDHWTLDYTCEVAIGPRFFSGTHSFVVQGRK